MQNRVLAFRTFVDRAKALLPSTDGSFIAFLNRARPLLLQEWPTRRKSVQYILGRIQPWVLDPHTDLLHVAGLAYVENAYTSLLAWCLQPAIHPTTALTRQQAWLKTLGIQEVIDLPAVPILQLITDDGIPDLVLVYRDFFVVMEAKTGTEEHATPTSGQPQTVSYLESVRRRLGIDPEKKGIMVFLTPDGRAAANPEAIATTFLRFVWTFTRNFKPEDFGEPVRTLLSLIFSHLCGWTTPAEVRMAQVLKYADPGDLSENWYLANMDFVNVLQGLIHEGDDDGLSQLQ